MAHFAQLDPVNIVIQVVVINNDVVGNLPFPDSEPLGVAFCKELYGADTVWKQTSYNSTFRKNYAGIGSAYDPVLDAFVSPKPFPSWLFNTTTCQWQAPVPYPTDGKEYYWDETVVNWVPYPDSLS